MAYGGAKQEMIHSLLNLRAIALNSYIMLHVSIHHMMFAHTQS
jgi:hypothetical protein